MSLKRLVKNTLRPITTPLLDAIAKRLAPSQRSGVEEKTEFDLRLLAVLRSLTASGDHRVLLPFESTRPQGDSRAIRIGFFGNIANNAYQFTKCLRRLGHDAELVVEDGGFDAFLLNRPFWEDVEVECDSYEEGLGHEPRWTQPPYVRRVAYDTGMQVRFQGRYSAVGEVQTLYKEAFGRDLPADRALLLAQQMGHWPCLLAMKRYDVVQLSGAAICLGAFCPKPYVVFPTGSDLFISPFEETLFGMLMRVGYRNAGHLLVCETNYPEYLDRLDLAVPRSFAPLMIDTDTYVPGKSIEARARWMKMIGGKRFILGVCRQSWAWKGNDRLIHAFHALVRTGAHEDWRLVLMQWGPDVERTKKLIAELGLEGRVGWERLASKPLVRKLQQAADLVVDQVVMAGYGTSVLESMAAGKPVLMARQDSHAAANLPSAPPVLSAGNPEEILRAFVEGTEGDGIIRRGNESLEWVHAVHGYRAAAPAHMRAYQSALGLPASGLLPEGERSPRRISSRGLLEDLQRLHGELRKEFKEKHHRSVPLADELTDRWERARFLGFGDASSIYDSALVLGDVRVGKNTWIGPNCILDGSGGLEIGSNCSVASGCHLYSHDTVEWALSGGNSAYQRKPTRIGDACYLGPHALITAGVTIGSHCLVGALSLVNRDVPDYSIVAGVPARVIGRVEVGPDFRVSLHYDTENR